jgi:hypothetical protein
MPLTGPLALPYEIGSCVQFTTPLGNFLFDLIPAQGMPSRGEVFPPCRERQPPKFRKRGEAKFDFGFVVIVERRL